MFINFWLLGLFSCFFFWTNLIKWQLLPLLSYLHSILWCVTLAANLIHLLDICFTNRKIVSEHFSCLLHFLKHLQSINHWRDGGGGLIFPVTIILGMVYHLQIVFEHCQLTESEGKLQDLIYTLFSIPVQLCSCKVIALSTIETYPLLQCDVCWRVLTS